jgi:hypothetical protein
MKGRLMMKKRARRAGLVCGAAALLLAGCVERTLLIRSDPAGARVVVNGVDAGLTPHRLRFQTYGVFDVMLSAEGCHRLRAPVPVEAPWYQQAPLDFFTEVLWPFTIHDDQEVLLVLKPYSESEDAGVEGRESDLRARTEEGTPPGAEQP